MNCKYLFYLLFSILPFARGQSPAPAPETPEPTPTPSPDRLFFSVYVWPTTGILTRNSEMPVIPRTFYDSPSGMRQVQLARATTSEVYPYIGTSPLVLYDIERTVEPPPENAPPGTEPTVVTTKIPVMRASFPRGTRKLNLIAFPAQKEADGTILTFPMPVFEGRLSAGEATVYNASDSPVVLTDRENKQSLQLRPYQTKKLPNEWHGRAPDRIQIYKRDKNNRVQLAAMTRIRSREDRVNLFFLYPKGDRHMRILNVGSQLPGDAVPFPPDASP